MVVESTSLEREAMSAKDLVFFVLGGVAPMAVIVAVLPLSIGLGDRLLRRRHSADSPRGAYPVNR